MSKYGTPEIYTRFLRKDWLKSKFPFIHYTAFMPDFRYSPLETSCYETQGLSIKEIEKMCEELNIKPNNKKPVGQCSIYESEFPFSNIDIDKNYNPERHINLVGWEKHIDKSAKILIASELANIASAENHYIEYK